MFKITTAIFLLITIYSSSVQSAEKDATYSACLDVITNGFDNAKFENQLYLTGRENGIEAGVSLAYKKHKIKDSLPTISSYPYIIDKACRSVIVDKSERRAMTVFNEKVFILYISK